MQCFESTLTLDRPIESGVVGNLDTKKIFVDDYRALELALWGTAGCETFGYFDWCWDDMPNEHILSIRRERERFPGT